MSSSYSQEPPSTAKVILYTSVGEIAIDLFASQTPLACKSFIQNCLDNYYLGCEFHRVVPGFCVQTGDPSNTGDGGVNGAYGAPFADEIHSRLRFRTRGMVAMANANKPNSNGSQFFITLDKCEELERKHTIFGKVADATIFNVIRIGEGELEEGTERPVHPVRITGAEVVVNPFENVVARTKKAADADEAAKDTAADGKGKVRQREGRAQLSKARKNLVSFDDDDGDGGGDDDELVIVPKRKVARREAPPLPEPHLEEATAPVPARAMPAFDIPPTTGSAAAVEAPKPTSTRVVADAASAPGGGGGGGGGGFAARLAKWKGQSSAARDKVKGKGKEESTLARLARFQGKLDSSAAGTAVRAHKLAFGDK